MIKLLNHPKNAGKFVQTIKYLNKNLRKKSALCYVTLTYILF